MPSRASWIALGVGAYVAFAAAQFPATLASRWFLPDDIRLAGVSGTVWSGSAQLGAVGGVPISELRWTLNATPLLLGRIHASLESRLADGFLNTDAEVSTQRIRLRELRAGASLQSLRDVLPVYGAEGQTSVMLERMDIEDGWPVALIGEIRIAALRVAPLFATAGVDMIELGDYRAIFVEQAQPGLLATLADDGGPLELMGRFTLSPDRAYVLDGLVRARANASPMLEQGLSIMTSEPNESGQRSITLTGTL
jgi:general secretion pathway protein N